MRQHPILRGLHRDVRWSGTHDLALVALSLASFLMLQRALAPAEYGAYFAVYGLVGVFGAVTISGVTFAALQASVAEPDTTDEILRRYLSLVLVASALAVLAAGALAWGSLRLGAVEIAAIAVGELLAAGVIAVAAVLTHARAGFAAAVRVRLPVVGLRLAALVALFAAGALDIRNLALCNLIALSAYATFLVFVHLPRHGYRMSLGVPTRESARSSAAFAIPTGASQLQTDGDKYFLNVFGHDADGGVYGVAYRVVQLASLPLGAIENAAFHRFLPSDGSRGQHTDRARAFLVVMLSIASVAAVGVILLVPLLDRLLAPSYDGALDIVPWLVLLVPLSATRSIPLNSLLGLGRADVRMVVYVASGAVTMVCYLALIPSLSWRGAVISTFVGEGFLAGAGWLALVRLQRAADRDGARQVDDRA